MFVCFGSLYGQTLDFGPPGMRGAGNEWGNISPVHGTIRKLDGRLDLIPFLFDLTCAVL